MSGYFSRNTNFEIKKIEKSDCQGQGFIAKTHKTEKYNYAS
jgi:hypothetical protein